MSHKYGTGLNRRKFLQTASVVPPVLAALLKQPASWAQAERLAAPYLKLAPFVAPGTDEFPEEAQAMLAEAMFRKSIVSSELANGGSLRGAPLLAEHWNSLGDGVSTAKIDASRTGDVGFRPWLESLGTIRRAGFFVLPENIVRYEVASETNGELLYTTGQWRAQWSGDELASLIPVSETRARAKEPRFRDVTGSVFESSKTFAQQFAYGVPYWRARLDPATGIDIYGSNGVAVGDIDGDGVDEVFICQPGGLPNRLLRYRDKRFEDITDQWGLGLLDDTSAALFLDLRNSGRQDLVVLRSAGPLLYVNEGGRFRLRRDAFQFANRPQGGFTGMAAADYDRDGKLDLYLCTYVYFQSEAQYTYATPYHDAKNGPPNFLFHNRLTADGSGAFEDVTEASGVNENNNRFSFAPTWGDTNGDGQPDLYVANDFGRNNFYQNEGGKFRDRAADAGIEDIGPGMSSSWFDYDGDGRPDLYVGNMWSSSGQRTVQSPKFTPAHGDAEFTEAYRRHTKGNSLYQNKGNGSFAETTSEQGVAMGRWAWSSVGRDLDNDGVPEIAIGCGMLTNKSNEDMMSFFWRQVVARSPQTDKRSPAYENGWNAINQFIREDYSWNGHEPNVFYKRYGERFIDVSGISGMDFADDTRAFAIADFDGDGRPDLILKNRLGPQMRVLQNNCAEGNQSICFDLQGTRSNRDAIGAKIEIPDGGPTLWLSAESGYLSQHSKRVTAGLGQRKNPVRVRVTWPSGAIDEMGPLEPGHTYKIVEGTKEYTSKPFSRHEPLEEKAIHVDNEPRLHTTWFVEPLPLPQSQAGPALLIVGGSENVPLPAGVPLRTVDLNGVDGSQRTRWSIFRRYLFDYRQDLQTPLALLIDGNGKAAKVYASVPSASEVNADLKVLSDSRPRSVLPFPGVYENQPRRDYFKFAVAMLWAGEDEAALPYLNEVLRSGSENPRIPMLIGQIYLQAGRMDDAEQYLRKAISWNPKYADAWSELGGVYEARKNMPQALSCYETALSFEPNLSFVQLNAAHAAEQTGNSAKAERYYRRVLDSDPKSAEAANGLGLMMAKRGDFTEAKNLFEQAIQAKPDFSSAINNLGVLFLNAGQVNDAIAAFEYGLKVTPKEDVLYLNLGRVYARQGKFDQARGVMQRLLALKPGNETAERALKELENR